jgi:signal transduction histidine kinase
MSTPPSTVAAHARTMCLRAADRSRVRRLLQRALLHDLRSPLNAASLRLDMVAHFLGADSFSREDRWSQMENVESLRAEFRRVVEALDGLLPLPEPGSGRTASLDLVEELPRLARLMLLVHQSPGVRPGIQIETDLPEEACRAVSIDSGVEHAFLNVTVNALEAMPQGGTLALGIRRSEGELLWVVEDEGPGVPPERAADTFEPYTSTKEGHAGLGLHVARQILEEHGGTIELTARPGGGTRVAVRLRREEPGSPTAPEGSGCLTPF